jgi:hypothetical protein
MRWQGHLRRWQLKVTISTIAKASSHLRIQTWSISPSLSFASLTTTLGHVEREPPRIVLKRRVLEIFARSFFASDSDRRLVFNKYLAAIHALKEFRRWEWGQWRQASCGITIFNLLGKPDNLRAAFPDCAHDFLEIERQQDYAFLDEYLLEKPR